jgi:hypothetical protein
MNKLKITFFVLLFISSISIAQQKLLFGFAENPQSLMLNPGAETNYRYHVGVPFLSGFSFNFNSTDLVLKDLFLNDGIDFSDKVTRTIDKLDKDDYIHLNTRLDVLNGGYRYNDKTYVSFGFYQEVDFIMYFPKDIAVLFNQGNAPFLNRPFSVSQLAFKADILGVLHAGISRKLNERLNVGARVKVYSSSLNVETNNNSGTFTTIPDNTNLLRQYLSNVDVNIKSSGIVENDETLDNPSSLFTNTFLGGNLGLGVDVGFTYHISPQLELSGSLLDFGFIKHSKRIKNFTAKGDFVFDGINFQYDGNNTDYWNELDLAFDEQVPNGENENSYVSWRPTKVNAALKYSFGQRRSKVCYAETNKEYYYNAVGAQLHSVFRPHGLQFALTSFFEASITEKFHTRFTHTINDFSSTNFGVGFVGQLFNVSVFGMVDNIIGLTDIASANSASITLGVNMVFD